MNVPRLPFLPVVGGGYEPPPAQASPPEEAAQGLEARANQEVYATTIALPAQGLGSPGTPHEVSVYKTVNPWRACDVYVTPGAFAGTAGLLSVFVYAVAKGNRTLVASGRYFINGSVINGPRWIAAARSVAGAFEVTAMWTQPSGAASTVGKLDVAVVASNEAVDPSDEVGAELGNLIYLSSSLTGVGVNVAGVQIPPTPELISVRGTNGAAAARWLQLFDSNAVIPANGSTPLMCWGMGAAIGASLPEMRVRYRAKQRIQLVSSSTMLTLTVVVDCAIGAVIR